MDGGYGALSSSKKAKGKEKVETMEASKTISAVEGEDNSSAAGGLSLGDVGANASQRDEATDVWAKKMQDKIDDLFQKPHNYTASRNISAVPASTEEHCKKLYEPRAVAIGPYHRKTEDNYFSITDEHKLWCVRHVIGDNYKQDLGIFLGKMKERGKDAWEFYEKHYRKDPGMDPQSFLEMLILDSCFILFALQDLAEVVREFMQQHQSSSTIPWALRDIMLASDLIKTDLLLLHNQIPFFIIDDVCKMHNEGKGSIMEDALKFFDVLGLERNANVIKKKLIIEEIDHLLQLYRLSLAPQSSAFAIDPQRSIPRATELQQKSAMKFKVKKMVGEAQSILDVTCKHGVIQMPALHVYDYTDILFHNLIAFERTPTFTTNSYITAYVAFMVHIVQREGDVELLENSGVLEHRLAGPAEVVALFRQLHDVIDHYKTPGYLAKVYEDVKDCYSSKWRRMYADAKQRYCFNVWASISFVAAMAALVLTFLDIIYAILDFYRS